ncbi:MAG: HDOD domain-containing protein [Rhodocyclaceae bacterium]|nr:HDOD domain-containing protein [Rhodocyclaceae bacterium]MBX3667888.1 HDOD domain-containing protein [Rhodocyclaceae bacterium]
MSAVTVPNSGLQSWVERIRDQEMPVFGATAGAVGALIDSERASAASLGRVILRDPGMTARVLKLANSAYFHNGGASISTISRAIVVLGFDLVRSVALSVALVDSVVQGEMRNKVVREMARSFHAAVHARNAAQKRGDGSPEEVFIAALLGRIGELAFWCFSGATGEVLDRVERESGLTEDEAEIRVLGFRLRQLTALLAKEWKLSPLLQSLAQYDARPGSREMAVVLAHRLARAAEYGWESAAAQAALHDMAEYTGQPVANLAETVAQTAEEAARIAHFYCMDEAVELIPVPNRENLVETPAEQTEPPWRGPDLGLQLGVAREMSALMGGRPAPTELLDMALEGIFRGAAFDQVVFAAVSTNRSQLAAKVVLGEGAERLQRRFQFALAGVPRDVVTDLVERQRSYRIDGTAVSGMPSSGRLHAALGDTPCVLAPLCVNAQTIGAIYAARTPAHGAVGEEDLQAVLHFVRLAALGLELNAARRRG